MKNPLFAPPALSFVVAFVLLSCGSSYEAAKNVRVGSPELVGFDSKKLARLDSMVNVAIRDSAFPAAQLLVAKEGLIAYNKSFGRLTYDANAQPTTLHTLFDVASLTKVVAATTAVMRLIDQRKIALDDEVRKFIPQFDGGRKSQVTIRHLLAHTSGLPPFRQLWKFVSASPFALDSVYATNLAANPGDTTMYSDMGFIILGKIVEQVSGKRLDVYVKENFFEPLAMTRTTFKPPQEENIAPTEYDTLWRKKLVQGRVHDENADFLGGVSGHAGLFSTASDLAVFMQMVMNGGTYSGIRFLESSTVAAFTKKQSEKSSRALGWDTKSPTGSSAGGLFSPNSFGHTGFTGTSIWADPERNLFVILLTNRVHPTRANTKISKVRPAVADAVIEALKER